MIKTISSLLFLLYGCIAQEQTTLSGKVETNSSWKQQLYLLEISQYYQVFSGSNGNIVDSIPLAEDGSFHYHKLKKNTLYRLNAVPGNESNGGMLIQDGEHDNYTYFVTGEHKADVYFTGAIDHLYASYQVSSKNKSLNELLQQILYLRTVKFPHYEFLHRFGIARAAMPPGDTAAIEELEGKAMKQFQQQDDSLNLILAKRLPSFKNPLILSLGLVYYGFDFHLSGKTVQQAAAALSGMKRAALSQSVLDAIAAAPAPAPKVFMDKEYPLIAGGTIKLSSISSRFILLDFWASWCMPCRKGIRTSLKNLKQQSDEKQLTIVGVNMDKDKEKALLAIQKDSNPFTQIYEVETNDLGGRFNVEALPYYLLIDTRTGTTEHLRTAEAVEARMRKEQGSK